MRPIVLALNVSVDGFFEGPQRDITWHRVDEELHSHFNAEHRAASLYLDGRRTWQLMADHWPAVDQNPDATPVEREYAGIWRNKPKIVWSRTLPDEPGWGTQVRREVDPDEVRALRAGDGGPIHVGGAELTAEFVRHRLVDELWWYVHPVVLGEGRAVFGPGAVPDDVRLVETRTFGNGVTLLRYALGTAPV